MGYDVVRGIGTYGHGCMPGAERLFSYLRAKYNTGTLGCYNPASVASGRPSLHAEGRAMDLALNANNPADKARGDALFDWVMVHYDEIGAQEMLFRGYLWSYKNRHLGKRGPGHQQAAHMNHVHLGIDVNAAKNWRESWIIEPEDDIVKGYLMIAAGDPKVYWVPGNFKVWVRTPEVLTSLIFLGLTIGSKTNTVSAAFLSQVPELAGDWLPNV